MKYYVIARQFLRTVIAQMNLQCRYLSLGEQFHTHRNLMNTLRLEMHLINALRLGMRVSVERLSGPCARTG